MRRNTLPQRVIRTLAMRRATLLFQPQSSLKPLALTKWQGVQELLSLDHGVILKMRKKRSLPLLSQLCTLRTHNPTIKVD
jgi:hypothetical protein